MDVPSWAEKISGGAVACTTCRCIYEEPHQFWFGEREGYKVVGGIPATCIHQPTGLCPACQAEYDEDPVAWMEYGDHPAGLANWRALQAEMDEQAQRPHQDDSGAGNVGDDVIPF
jgi:hypothetical protein